MTCFICGNKELFKFLSLGHQPPSDAFLQEEDLFKPEITYPLDLYFCEKCGLVQLGYIVSPELLFRNYVYNAGTNNSLKQNFSELVKKLVKRFNLTASDLAVDIGSNDGTLLENYLPYKVKILGIDPSSVAQMAIDKGIFTIANFFTQNITEQIVKSYGQAKIITATNVFAHVDKLKDFMVGVRKLLTDDGIFVSESNYLLDFINKLQYDAAYHEHLRYYSLKPLKLLFEEFGLEIFDVERISTHGGSIRVYTAKKEAYPVESNVEALIRLEEESGLYRKETYIRFAKRVQENKIVIQELLIEKKNTGGHIVGIGAPAKGNTLLNYCKLDKELIDYLAEKSSLKIGTFSPGVHIPVVSEERLFTDQPDYALVLSWNIADELMPKLRGMGYKGKFILPTPEPKIV